MNFGFVRFVVVEMKLGIWGFWISFALLIVEMKLGFSLNWE